MATKSAFYAVKQGRKIGIYKSWNECLEQVKGYPKAVYKKFPTLGEAEAFLRGETATAKGVEEEKDIFYAYVDGSYINGCYGWGMVIYRNGEVVIEANGSGDNPEMAALHNVAGEILGAMEAAKWAYANDEKIVLCHDYNGIAAWALGQWQRNKALTKYYHEFMQEYLPLITFKKVAGHTGIKGNERADILAKQAVGLA